MLPDGFEQKMSDENEERNETRSLIGGDIWSDSEDFRRVLHIFRVGEVH